MFINDTGIVVLAFYPVAGTASPSTVLERMRKAGRVVGSLGLQDALHVFRRTSDARSWFTRLRNVVAKLRNKLAMESGQMKRPSSSLRFLHLQSRSEIEGVVHDKASTRTMLCCDAASVERFSGWTTRRRCGSMCWRIRAHATAARSLGRKFGLTVFAARTDSRSDVFLPVFRRLC